MSRAISALDIEAALENCANEPVHAPGMIQPVGALIVCRGDDWGVTHASANAPGLLALESADLLGRHVRDAFGKEVWHELANAAAMPDFGARRAFVGVRRFGDEILELHGFGSGDLVVIEVERRHGDDAPGGAFVTRINQLIDRIGAAEDETDLMRKAVRLLKAVTGYDRVLAYRFDEEHNGEVIAEQCEPGMDGFIGLRFPSWDIPAQARAIMAKLPLRFISDVDQDQVPIAAIDPKAPPVDISLAVLRAVSPVHLEYLRNMGSAATMTLSVRIGGALWGMISFHHRRPRTPSTEVRRICEAVLPFVEARLSLALKQAELSVVERIDELRDEVEGSFRGDLKLRRILETLAPAVLDAFDAQGFLSIRNDEEFSYGVSPSADARRALIAALEDEGGAVFATDRLAPPPAGEAAATDAAAGALAARVDGSHVFAVFRASKAQTINWAGAPEKDIVVDGPDVRLSPRGSFTVYAQKVSDRSAPWTQGDMLRFRRLAETIVGASERHSQSEVQSRQQDLMIEELNHRVRNILTLIRSVTRQSLRGQSSMDSYRDALERRIKALAAAHDLGAGEASDSVSVRSILRVEAEPYLTENESRVVVRGADRWVKAHQTSIFALVVHELMTNAAKYGALSRETGRIEIDLLDGDGLRIEWAEFGGPKVARPQHRGFGSELVENAIPFEFGGAAELTFDPEGLRAAFWLPEHVLDAREDAQNPSQDATGFKASAEPERAETAGAILLVEDNFVLAVDLADTLNRHGLSDVRLASNGENALAAIATGQIRFALLDINLGGSGEQSFAVARALTELKTPFAFATGYGDAFETPSDLTPLETLTKPVSDEDLIRVVLEGLRR